LQQSLVRSVNLKIFLTIAISTQIATLHQFFNFTAYFAVAVAVAGAGELLLQIGIKYFLCNSITWLEWQGAI